MRILHLRRCRCRYHVLIRQTACFIAAFVLFCFVFLFVCFLVVVDLETCLCYFRSLFIENLKSRFPLSNRNAHLVNYEFLLPLNFCNNPHMHKKTSVERHHICTVRCISFPKDAKVKTFQILLL